MNPVIAAQLEQEGYVLLTWSNAPNFSYASHAHVYNKVIVVLAGSIRFEIVGAEPHELNVGDQLRLAAGMVHSALVGPRGVTCLEGHK